MDFTKELKYSKDIQQNILNYPEFTYLKSPINLFSYQEFVRRYMSPYTKNKYLLIYHELGSGKSVTAISVAYDNYKIAKRKILVLCKGESSEYNFKGQVEFFKKLAKVEFDDKIIEYYHFIQMVNNIRKNPHKDFFSDRTVIIDEVHNIKSKKGKTINTFHEAIKKSTNSKFLFLTGTPMTDSALEINFLLMLTNKEKIKDIHNEEEIQNFRESIKGIISYSSMAKNIPTEIVVSNDTDGIYYNSVCKGIQLEAYQQNIQSQHKDVIYTNEMQVSLFVDHKGNYGNNIKCVKYKNIKYKTKDNEYICKEPYFDRQLSILFESLGTLEQKVEWIENYSCIYHSIIKNIINVDKKVFIYIRHIKGSGIMVLASLFKLLGYEIYNGEDINTLTKAKRIVYCVGEKEYCKNIKERIEGFNDEKNTNGEYVQIIIGSKVIGEAISLVNVKHFHFVSPHWNKTSLDQAKARVFRGSDKENSNIVYTYYHKVSKQGISNKYEIIDSKKERISATKLKDIKKIEEILKEEAIDRYITENKEMKLTESFSEERFVAFYGRQFYTMFLTYIEDIMSKENILTMTDLIDKIKTKTENILYNTEMFITEVLKTIVLKNILIQNKYMRFCMDEVFLTDNILYPYFGYNYENSGLKREICYKSINNIYEFIEASLEKKITFIEEAISKKNTFITKSEEHSLPFLFIYYNIEVNNEIIVFHFLEYKKLKTSYNALSNIKPNNLTRYYKDNKWNYIDDIEKESLIIERYEKMIRETQKEIISEYPIFGFLSLVDLNMRFINKNKEDIQDKRKHNRGMNIMSYNKETIKEIVEYINANQGSEEIQKGTKIFMIDQIKSYIIKKNMFCFV